MKRHYYSRALPIEELVKLYNEDYWRGQTSDFEGGILSHNVERERYYSSVADKVVARKPKSVLEVGCGLGQVVAILRQRGIKAEGVDVSPWAVENAVTPIVLGNALALPFADKEFDLVFSHDFLEHIPLVALGRVSGELERVGERNYHIISCGSLPNDRDITHVTMHRISWWRRRALPSFEMEMKD